MHTMSIDVFFMPFDQKNKVNFNHNFRLIALWVPPVSGGGFGRGGGGGGGEGWGRVVCGSRGGIER